MRHTLMIFCLVLAVSAAVHCSKSKKKSDVGPATGEGVYSDGYRPGDDDTDDGRPRSPAFRFNGDICKIHGSPRSAVTSKVEVTPELLDALAVRLEEEGYQVYRWPDSTMAADGAPGDVTEQVADLVTRESVGYWEDGSEDAPLVPPVDDVVSGPDLPPSPQWTGGEYLVASTQLSDLLFVVESGTIGVASWCPAHSLGQIRRLDYALADALGFWAELVGLDYASETDIWSQPVAYHTTVGSSYQRSYMNESLDMNEPHGGQLSVSGKPVMAGFVLYGHADAPSAVGDVVGVDLLQLNQAVIAENDTVTVTGQVVRLWDLTPFAGEGENVIMVDPSISDASINWQVGVYHFFAETIFPETLKGSLVLNLQGSPPGKLLVSREISILEIPPWTSVL